ncbi:hypothetical protein ACVR0P_00810 [Streptococcus castoreus]|uniref:hypothetical protein n=1 Tax=Streptococcus castoreus TaxID=254786 RepID=UPI00041C576D|nr:hypothetical protein [Streptococcus castoreus]
MKIKKVWLILSVCILVSLLLIPVKADDNTTLFQPEGQQRLSGVTVKPFRVGDQTINVNVEPYAYVYASITSSNDNKVKKPGNRNYEVPCSELERQSNSNSSSCEGKKWTVSGYRADGGGNVTVQLEKPLQEGDYITLSFADDGNILFGQLVYINVKTAQDKQRKKEEQSYAENLFKRAIEKEIAKTWYQRLEDSIQDSWWNFTDWLI